MSGILVLVLRILAAGALYTFIGWALYTLWRSLNSEPIRIDPVPTLHITPVAEGAQTRVFNLPLITIGRSENCTFKLKHNSISSTHARLSYHHQQWWLEDLGSTNGTFLNDSLITTPTIIIDGDQFQIGSEIFQIHIYR
jgi:pSer/pThr/pTyr-binding forkhead associated (FHA) protein